MYIAQIEFQNELYLNLETNIRKDGEYYKHEQYFETINLFSVIEMKIKQIQQNNAHENICMNMGCSLIQKYVFFDGMIRAPYNREQIRHNVSRIMNYLIS